jgi:hypothetical protein
LPSRAAPVSAHLFADAAARQFRLTVQAYDAGRRQPMNNITKTGLAIAMGMVAFVTAASADAVPAGRFQVPFQFLAGDTVLPAGDYTVKIDSASNRIELHSWNGSAGLLLTADAPHRDVAGSRTGKLVFHRYANALVLGEMWRHGSGYGHRLSASRMEREMAGKAASAAAAEIASLARR